MYDRGTNKLHSHVHVSDLEIMSKCFYEQLQAKVLLKVKVSCNQGQIQNQQHVDEKVS